MKGITLIIVPHSPSKVFSRYLPSKTVKRCLVSLALSAVALCVFCVRYIALSKNMVELAKLRAVNAAQEQRILELTEQAKEATEKLEQLLEFEKQLREMLQREGIQVQQGRTTSSVDQVTVAGLLSTAVGPGGFGVESTVTDALGRLDDLQAEFQRVLETVTELEQRRGDIEQTAQELVKLVRAKPDMWPTAGTLTSRFGYRRPPTRYASHDHKGIDIAAPYGTPIYAAGDGTVKYAGWYGGLGKLIIIEHGFGLETYYGHCSQIKVRVGQQVKKGQAIGTVGATGIATGPHLHYQVVLNGVDVDPLKYLPYGR
ncbi:MAG: peptidoglycan DD-metalloendopeptidase family protein [Bacillota bacterium]